MQEMRTQQEKKYKIGYVPGVYDLFHIGHLNLIRRAKEQSEYLMVGVLTDELVEHFKGKRPYIPFEERIEIVAALKEVDEVVKVDFSNTVKMDAWKIYHYDAYFSGNDHENEWNREKQKLQAVGSDIVFLPYTQGTSSTMIKKQIREALRKERIYIFGAGKIGQAMHNKLRTDEKYERWEIVGFLDNSSIKYLTRMHGVPVFKPEDLRTLETNADYSVLIAMKDREAAVEQLNGLALDMKKLYLYDAF